MVYRHAPIKRLEVKELGEANYLNGRKQCREQGFGQISLLKADELIMNKDPRITRSCLVKELVAYTEKNEKFQKGKDVIDTENKLKLRWDDIIKLCDPKDFAEMLKIALLITPSVDETNFTEEDSDGNVIVVPENILIIPGFLQQSGWGIRHLSGLIVEGQAETETRFLCRSISSRFGSVIRGLYDYNGRRGVIASYYWCAVYGVVGVREIDVPIEQ